MCMSYWVYSKAIKAHSAVKSFKLFTAHSLSILTTRFQKVVSKNVVEYQNQIYAQRTLQLFSLTLAQLVDNTTSIKS